MDAIRQQLLRVQQQLDGLSASQKMLTASLVAIMVMTVAWWARTAGSPEMEPLLDQPMAVEDLSRIKGYLAGRNIAYRIEGDRVMLPADKRFEAWVDLGALQMLPKDTSDGFDKAIEKMSPWDPQSKTRAFLDRGKEQMLARVVGSFPDVQSADVLLNTQQERKVGGDLKPSASVRIRMARGHEADNGVVKAAADFVANAVSGLELSNIAVIVNGVSRRVPGASASGGAGGFDAGEMTERQNAVEARFAQKIQDQLFFIPGVRATVTVRMNTRSTNTTSERVEDVKQSESETLGETEETSAPLVALPPEPGVVPNAGLAIPAAGPIAGEGARTSRERTESRYDNFPSIVKEQVVEAPGEATPIGAAVRVPRSYLVKAWRAEGDRPADAVPTPEEMRQIALAQTDAIRSEVVSCTGMADRSAVSVLLYTEIAPDDADPPAVEASAVAGVVGVVGGYGKELVLGAFVAASLVMVTLIARRPLDAGATSGVVGGDLELAAAAAAVSGSGLANLGGLGGRGGALADEQYAELGEQGDLMTAQEIDDDAARSHQVVEQVATLVKENPEAAATLVKRWMAR